MDRMGVCIKMAGDLELSNALAETAMGKEIQRLKIQLAAVTEERDLMRDAQAIRYRKMVDNVEKKFGSPKNPSKFKEKLLKFVHLFVERVEEGDEVGWW